MLEAAEAVIAETGAAGLTFESVAAAAGVTKGGIQSCFASKEALIEALLRRWGALYDADVARLSGPGSTARDRVRAHVRSTAEADDAANARAAALLAALLQSPDNLAWARDWYAERFGDLKALDGPEAVRARLAFLATEGLFFLRHFGLVSMTRREWERHFDDIAGLLPERERKARAGGGPRAGKSRA
ncbi:TetR/AcrR family transcriptional regulator [Vulcaniibacterium tengchongense]|uniref:TetR/AcrR family transcriptional regulator n=1 Tax=Vulcaniibacterium tengchongense TaxID=1273429 RepID=UPI0018F7B5E8|nr:TetR/AcrR family transcriptional regulator [Vulcaniibacterium tengchongense]